MRLEVEAPTLDDRQKTILNSFADALAKCQAISFVAIVKPPGRAAEFITGGYKGEGPTFVDLAKAVGALVGDLTNGLMSAMKSQGKEIVFEQALAGILEAVVLGARSAEVVRGKTRIEDAASGGNNPKAAPRGF